MSAPQDTGRISRISAIVTVIAVLVAAGMAAAGSRGGAMAAGLPVFAICVGVAFVVQWIAFVPAFVRQTERFYDITGTVTYIGVTVIAVLLAGRADRRSLLLAALIIVWAARLGTYLVRRIHRAGKDDRFDAIKPIFFRFLLTWTMQGLWVTLTAGAALAAITSGVQAPLDGFALAGAAIWLVGFAIEVAADLQKSAFRANPANKGRFISKGVWAWSRHPNYFGEIVLWVGVAVIAFPVLSGAQLLTLVSPLFVTLLLTRVSGIPLLEKKADATWGGQADYEAYKASTPVLVPRPPRG